MDHIAFCNNALLCDLPDIRWAEIARSAKIIDLKVADVLHQQAHVLNTVIFPTSGMLSLLRHLDDGTSVEVGLIGSEGFFGVPILLGATTSPLEVVVQGKGMALCVPVSAFQKAVDADADFRQRLLVYAQCLHIQVSQTAVCNGRHKLLQRLARWLLECNDRMHASDLALSKQFLSHMLGVRRAGVSEAVMLLEERGIVTSRRGTICVVDRPGLERAACECYKTVREETQQLLAGQA